MKVSGVIVTRGDVDLSPILHTMEGLDEVIIWDNSKTPDYAVFGRYLGMMSARNSVIYTQDDDCIVPVDEVVKCYTEDVLILNNPEYEPEDTGIVAWGAVFDKTIALQAISKYLSKYPLGDVFMRYCDYAFCGLTTFGRINGGHTDLPHASAPDRMYNQPNHYPERDLIIERCREIRF